MRLMNNMTKKIIIFIAAIAMIQVNIFAAKQTGSVKGRIVENSSKEAVSFATVALQSGETIKGGGITNEDGIFIIENVAPGNYTFLVSFIGQKSFSKEITVNGETLDMGDIGIDLNVQMLEGARVTAKRPVIEQQFDKIVMNVSEAVSTQGSNALEVLRKAPGVAIDKDGNVTLNGQAVSVWIDGRPSYLSGSDLEALLQSTDGNTIDKIEIISHPSAKYDAAGGGGIIDIKTKRNFLQGFNGSATLSYTATNSDPYVQTANGTLNLNYRTEKTNTFLTYSPRFSEDYAHFDSWTLFGNNYNMRQVSESDYLFTRKSNYFRVGNDYFINKKNTLGFIVTGMFRNNTESPYYGSWTEIWANGTLNTKEVSEIESTGGNNNLSANVNYTGVIDATKGEEVTINLDYNRNNFNRDNFQSNKFVDPLDGTTILGISNTFRATSDQAIDIYGVKVDYEKIVWKSGKLEAGIKYAHTYTDNNTLREDQVGGVWTKNDNLSSIFNYSEQISAAYASLAKMFNMKWIFKVGLRAEYTHSNGDWISANDKTTKSYINFFPTIYAGYNPSQNWRYSLSYTIRVNRPGFGQLNPYRQYVDANSAMEGNPDLNPQFTDQVSASIGYGSHFTLAGIFQNSRSMIMQAPYIEPDGSKTMRWENFGTMQIMGGALSITELPFTKWLIFNGNLFVASTSNTSSDDSYSKKGIMNTMYGNLTFLLPKSWKLEMGVTRQGRISAGYLNVDPQYMVFGGIKKTLLDGKGILTINFNDIFNSSATKVGSEDKTGKTIYFIDQKFSGQNIRVSFSYSFGQAKASKRRNVGNLEESSRIGESSGGISTSTNIN